jgi:hypothetical protein
LRLISGRTIMYAAKWSSHPLGYTALPLLRFSAAPPTKNREVLHANSSRHTYFFRETLRWVLSDNDRKKSHAFYFCQLIKKEIQRIPKCYRPIFQTYLQETTSRSLDPIRMTF